MEDYPRNLAEFEARFSTETACREYLARLRWPDGFLCLRCGGAEGLAGAWASAAVFGLRISELGDGRNNLPGHTQAAHGLVSGDVGSHEPEERCQRHRTPAGAEVGELRHRLGCINCGVPWCDLNHDYSVTLTFLIHAGFGYVHDVHNDGYMPGTLNYDPLSGLGLVGNFTPGMSLFSGLSSSSGGGMVSQYGLGMGKFTSDINDKPTAVLSATLVRGNHTYKIGGEWRNDP